MLVIYENIESTRPWLFFLPHFLPTSLFKFVLYTLTVLIILGKISTFQALQVLLTVFCSILPHIFSWLAFEGPDLQKALSLTTITKSKIFYANTAPWKQFLISACASSNGLPEYIPCHLILSYLFSLSYFFSF